MMTVNRAAAGRPPRTPPADFVDQCTKLTQNGLCAHYGCGSPLIKRWVAETGAVPLADARGERFHPDDLAERASEMHIAELARHYGVTEQRIRRLLAQTGIEARRYAGETHKARKAKLIPRAPAYAGPKSAFVGRLSRDPSLEGQAADHLRKFCAVYRCTQTGRADQRGTQWRYGNAVLTPEEMIARAERNGFDPNAWRRVAA